ncbi:MAG: molybdopterin-dependent oxidoreductase [Firmicutes bacterium]|nr:molybdopterin-dependent oxidoreductase [Bacillota bacterium]
MARRRKNQTLGIAIVLAVLIIAVGVLAYLNRGDLGLKKELEMQAEFHLVHGDFKQRVTMEDIWNLKPVEFSTVMRSGAGTSDVTFTGVELRRVLEKFGVNLQADSKVEVKALDGYASAFTGDEVLDPESLYITIAMDGKPLKPKGEGGFGPYFLVIRDSEFAQRWVKFVEEIVVR